MKPGISGLRTVIYKVPDIASSKKWYAEAFGTPPYFDEPFYVGFNIGGYELGLQPEENTPNEQTDNVVAYWGVEDVPTEIKRFVGLGAIVHEQPTEVGGGIVVASVKDPWGNTIGLIYNPHFKAEE